MNTRSRRRIRTLIPVLVGTLHAMADPFDAAPAALRLPDGLGLQWEDPREIHRVVVRFNEPPSPSNHVHLEYWGSRWPEQRLPKDHEPGGGSVGWMELGTWYKYDWRVADAEVSREGPALVFQFRPVNAKEFPELKDYPARFRYTLKLRVVGSEPLPPITSFQAFTDSSVTLWTVRFVSDKPLGTPRIGVFNGQLLFTDPAASPALKAGLTAAANPDPNTFDRTVVTFRGDGPPFSFRVDDLKDGCLFLPDRGMAVTDGADTRDYAAIAASQKAAGAKTLYEQVKGRPEQTWQGAWNGLPRKQSRIYFPLGLDGGRQRFRLHASGKVDFRTNDDYLKGLPGAETPRLSLEKGGVALDFGLPDHPVHRTLVEQALPLCVTQWETGGVQIVQTAFVTPLEGTDPNGPVPNGDTLTVWMAEFSLTNTSTLPRTARLPFHFNAGPLRATPEGQLWCESRRRGQVVTDGLLESTNGEPAWGWTLPPGGSGRLVLKLPYVVLGEAAEGAALDRLDFDRQRDAVAAYWRRRLDQSARLVTPEPMLNEFYRSHAMHLLVNCEREPSDPRRFARVGSFGYGAYGNESCMMVVDLDRRGYATEAQECLDAWLKYQGSVGLPGDFESKEGVLYGAAGYESGGYNQHHGWILWCLAEHYRFTRNQDWLRQAAPGIVAGSDWIIRETARTSGRHPLERGLLPAGSLEDIGDWWTWLSTSCYTWRGLDAAAWALTEINHPDAARIRAAANAYHAALVGNFREAMVRAPVVRLRDGTAVPKIPSQVHRRGRSFGWICETLEGSLHLLITRALDPNGPEASWILNDYEDNLYLSNQYGYTLPNFEAEWFGRGGMSMQACLLLDVEPYLYRDDVKHALRALFNGLAVSYFPDVRMNTEHALPNMEDWAGDHFKSSDESNAAGWLRYLFVREEGSQLIIGQAVPREWLEPGRRCGIERAQTYFGTASVIYEGHPDRVVATLQAPTRNPPASIRLRFRHPAESNPKTVTVNGKPWNRCSGDWVELPGDAGSATIIAHY